MGLRDYLQAIDSSNPASASAWLAEDLTYLLALPDGVATGSSKADFEDYIAAGEPVERLHHIVRRQTDGDTEFVVGTVTEKGAFMGSFLSAAVIAQDGRVRRYESFFTPDFQLHPWKESGHDNGDKRNDPLAS
jgi:hypothetical protein